MIGLSKSLKFGLCYNDLTDHWSIITHPHLSLSSFPEKPLCNYLDTFMAHYDTFQFWKTLSFVWLLAQNHFLNIAYHQFVKPIIPWSKIYGVIGSTISIYTILRLYSNLAHVRHLNFLDKTGYKNLDQEIYKQDMSSKSYCFVSSGFSLKDIWLFDKGL